jgi:hypothetical protein
MPWRCPACGIQIRHSPVEEMPRRGVRYRCHICRLELVIDENTNRLTVAPLGDGEAATRKVRPEL